MAGTFFEDEDEDNNVSPFAASSLTSYSELYGWDGPQRTTRSCMHSFIHSFTHLFIHSFIHSFIYSNQIDWKPLSNPFAPTDDAYVPDASESPLPPLDNRSFFYLPESVTSTAARGGHGMYGIPQDAVIPGR